jgi:hypothetical protein
MVPHGTDHAGQGRDFPEPNETALSQAMKEPEFKRFVEAQLTWDRAMAEALVQAKQNFGNAVVVGILSIGHVAGGHGVPRQLWALDGFEASSLIPATVDTACALIGTGYADAIFTLPHRSEVPLAALAQLGVFAR